MMKSLLFVLCFCVVAKAKGERLNTFSSSFGFSLTYSDCWKVRSEDLEDDPDPAETTSLGLFWQESCPFKYKVNRGIGIEVIPSSPNESQKRIEREMKGDSALIVLRAETHTKGKEKTSLIIKESNGFKEIWWYSYIVCPKNLIKLGFGTKHNEAADANLKKQVFRNGYGIPAEYSKVINSVQCK